MKSITKGLLVAGIAVSFAFMLQKHSDESTNESNNFATQVIKVSLDPSGKGLILDDGNNVGGNITTKVHKKTVVKWKLVNNSGITSLDSIVSKNGVDLFETRPTTDSEKGLVGKVGDFTSGSEEEYGIWYTIDGVSYMHDPVIQVH